MINQKHINKYQTIIKEIKKNTTIKSDSTFIKLANLIGEIATSVYTDSERIAVGRLFEEFLKPQINNYNIIEQNVLKCYNTCKYRNQKKDKTATNFGQAFYSGLRCKEDHNNCIYGFACAHKLDYPKYNHLDLITMSDNTQRILLIAEPFIKQIENIIYKLKNSKYYNNSNNQPVEIVFDKNLGVSGCL